MDKALDQLRDDIEYKFGKPINSKTSSMELSDEIFEVCSERVSYNTIRRFFGLTNTVVPRTSTLDIFSRYVGVNSFREYCNMGVQEKELLNQSITWSGNTNSKCGWNYTKLASGVLKSPNDRLKWHTLGLILRNLFLGKHYDKIKELLSLKEWENMRDFNQLDLMNKHINDLILALDEEEHIIDWIKHTHFVRVILSYHVDQGGVYPALSNQFLWTFKLSKVEEERAYAGSVLAFAAMVKGDWEKFDLYFNELKGYLDKPWYGFLMNRLHTLNFVNCIRNNPSEKEAALENLIQRNLALDDYHGKWTNESFVAACICLDESDCLAKYLEVIEPTERQGQRFLYETEIGNWHLLGRMYLAKKKNEDPFPYAEKLNTDQLSLQKHWFFNFMLRKIGMPEIKNFAYGTVSCRLV